MHNLKDISVLLVCCLANAIFSQSSAGADSFPGARREIYKTIGKVELALHIFEPTDHLPSHQRPAAVFFFGGGWVSGSVKQFVPHCEYLASRGMIGIVADYRVAKRHQTTPFECVRDGRSAVRWIRIHAKRLGIDPDRIAAGGGSAGGHVAAATETILGLDEPDEPKEVSGRPNLLLLFNPVYDNGPTGYGHDRIGDRYPEISPLHNIRKGIAPAIAFFGTNDKHVPVETAKLFQRRMREVGSQSELFLYDGQKHGFFNHPSRFYFQTVFEMDRFLASMGYLQGSPTIKR